MAATFRGRILSGYLLQVGLILIAFSATLYLVTRWRLTAELDGYLADQLRYLSTRVKLDDGDEVEFVVHEAEHPPDLFWRLALDDDRVLAHSRAFAELEDVWPSSLESISRGTLADGGHAIQIAQARAPNGVPMRLARQRIRLGGRPRRVEFEWKIGERLPDPEEKLPKRAKQSIEVVLTVGRSLEERDRTLFTLLLVLGAAVPATLVLSALGGWRLVRRAIRPIEDLTHRAERIGPDNLSDRVPVGEERDEIARLALVINGMLRRIEEGFERERQFTNDASHELRTPLTALQGHLEVALRRDRSPEEYREVLSRSLEGIRQLDGVVSGLLLLARADAGRLLARSEEIDVCEVIERAVESLDAEDLVDTAGAACTSAVGERLPATIRGDPDLLATLLRTLIENALRHGAPPVSISADVQSDRVDLVVADRGEGIPVSELDRVFERFHRVDRARSRRTGGAGLGLAIARSIATAHGGRIAAENDPAGGLRVTVSMPLVAAGSPSRE